MKLRPPIGLLLALLCAAGITGLLLLLPTGLLEAYDLARMHQCYRHDFRAAVLDGEWPWWNPHTALGRPFFADIETALLYPPTWLVIPFGIAGGIVLAVWLHLVLVITGTQRLAVHLGIRHGFAFLAGLLFALSGALLARIQAGQLQLFCVVCLWPWVWLAALRVQDGVTVRTVLDAAAWLALSFLAGSPHMLWCAIIPLIPLLLLRAATMRGFCVTGLGLVAAAMLAAALTAVQLVPFVELIHQGNRPLDDVSFSTRHGQTGASWLTLLMPPGPWLRSNWEFNLHGGALLAVGAVAALFMGRKDRQVRGLWAAVAGATVLALGDATPVLPALAEWIPGFAGIRYPSRYALSAVLALTVLAVWWLNRIWPGPTGRQRWIAGALTVHFIILLVGAWSQGIVYRSPPTPRHESQIRADLAAEGLPRDGAPPRAALPLSILRSNAGAQAGVSTVTGFNNPALARTWTSLYILAASPAPDFHRAEVPDDILLKLQPHLGLFSTAVTWLGDEKTVSFAEPERPRSYIGFACTPVADWREAARLIAAGHNHVAAPLIEQDHALPAPSSGSATTQIVHFSRNRVDVRYSATAAGLLVLAEAWYPGWRATVDGAPAAVLPVNAWMRAVSVPAGSHLVVFRFSPGGIAWAGIVSAFTLIGCALLWWQSGSAYSRAVSS